MLGIFRSHYSVCRSILTLDDAEEIKDNRPVSIFSILKQYELNKLFLLENSMSGFIVSYRQAKKHGIKLRFGLELTICEDINKKDEDSLLTEHKIILWLLKSSSYSALCKIYSKAFVDGFYYSGRIDLKSVYELKDDGILLQIPHYNSFIVRNLLEGYNCIPNFKDKPTFWLSNQDLPFDELINDAVKQYVAKNSCETIDTHQILYYQENDALAAQILRLIGNRGFSAKKRDIEVPNLENYSSSAFNFSDIKDNIDKNSEFGKRFEDYDFPLMGWTRLPKPPISNEDKVKIGLKKNDSNEKFLRQLCYLGFEEKLKKGKIFKDDYQSYIDRCEMELQVYKDLNFIEYMLLVWAVINKARNLGVFIDFGRGSLASSIVSWYLGITGVDPVINKLFFARFLSKARASSQIINKEVWVEISLAPDADLNLGEGREEIVKWLKEIYPNRICKVLNIITLTGKICIKDVYKLVGGADEEEANRVSFMVERIFGTVQKLEDVYKNSDEFKKWADENKLVYETCLKLEDCIIHTGVHASGYLISYDDLTNHTPLQLDSKKEIISAYSMDDVQSVKLDLLGLETNLLIRNILSETGQSLNDINLENDDFIYSELQNKNLQSYGLYQICSPCAYRVCVNLKPKNVMELSHVLAIARPATLRYEEPYIDNSSVCPHPIFEESLKWTRFQPLYQEQTISMLKAIGFDEINAEMARKSFAKKRPEDTEKWIKKVKEKIEENKLPDIVGDVLITLVNEAASYQFNLCLSPDTVVETENGEKMMFEVEIGEKVKAYEAKKGKDIFVKVKNKYENSTELYEVELDDGRKIKCSMNHKFFCEDLKMRSLESIIVGKFKILTD